MLVLGLVELGFEAGLVELVVGLVNASEDRLELGELDVVLLVKLASVGLAFPTDGSLSRGSATRDASDEFSARVASVTSTRGIGKTALSWLEL